MNHLFGRVALVTGASRGIGVTICRTLVKKDIKVIGVARSKEGLDQTERLIKEMGGDFKGISFDLSKTQQLPQLLKLIEQTGLDPDIFVFNAGIEKYSYFQNNSYENLESIINTNLLGPMELTRLILPKLFECKTKKSSIVLISSLAGKKGVIYNSVYSASKAGLIGWSDAMRQELKGSSVSISVICPGFIAEAGMFHEGQVTPPRLLGTSLPQQVADAVIKAIVTRKAEIIVNKGPIRPLLALGQISPLWADKIVEILGIKNLNLKRIS